MPFEAVAKSFSDLLNTTPEVAGFLLGFIVIIALIVTFKFMLGDSDVGLFGNVALLGAPMAFVILVGWWPEWTALLVVALVVAAVVFRGE